MLDNETRRTIKERIGETGAERIDRDRLAQLYPGTEPSDAEPFLDALWQTWVDVTLTMVGFGFSHRTLCDAAGEVAGAHEEYVSEHSRTT